MHAYTISIFGLSDQVTLIHERADFLAPSVQLAELTLSAESSSIAQHLGRAEETSLFHRERSRRVSEMAKKKAEEKRIISTPASTEPPPNVGDKVDWRKAGVSFRRLLRTRGEAFKRLCNAKTYRDYESI